MSIILDKVSKQFDQQVVVDNISLEINSGELFVLLGASGSGKSTILRIIAGLTELDSGAVSLNGKDVTHLPPQKRGTGFVFQNYSLFRHMNVAENIEFGLRIQRVPRREREARVNELLSLIGMEGLGNRMPTQLSGGQQQRVALARALAHNPEVLLLDEPFGALDVKIRSQLRQNLKEIQRRLGVTTILVTHDQDEAFELADRIGIIEQAQLLEVGSPTELYRRPRNRYTATFLGSANLLQGRRNGSNIYMDELTMPAPPDTEHLAGQPVEILLRPEEIDLALAESDLKGSALGQGVIEEINFAGAQERIRVRLPDRDVTLLVTYSPDDARRLELAAGRKVWVGIKDFHLLALQQS
jgi:sulfate/thiosulfate transport system ATP-binding protein